MEKTNEIKILLHELAVEFRKLLNKNEARKRG
jgi:hypothetical protein